MQLFEDSQIEDDWVVYDSPTLVRPPSVCEVQESSSGPLPTPQPTPSALPWTPAPAPTDDSQMSTSGDDDEARDAHAEVMKWVLATAKERAFEPAYLSWPADYVPEGYDPRPRAKKGFENVRGTQYYEDRTDGRRGDYYREIEDLDNWEKFCPAEKTKQGAEASTNW